MSSGIFLRMAGIRPDLAEALRQPFMLSGTAILLITCGLSTSLLLRLTRPEASMRCCVMAFLVLVVTTISVWAAAMLITDAVTDHAEVDMGQVVEAILSVLMLSIVPAFTSVNLSKRGATSCPGVSAALAGLTSSTGAAAGYSLHSSISDPAIFFLCTGLAILTVTAATVRFGVKSLRW